LDDAAGSGIADYLDELALRNRKEMSLPCGGSFPYCISNLFFTVPNSSQAFFFAAPHVN
jgi:hypothetical protein